MTAPFRAPWTLVALILLPLSMMLSACAPLVLGSTAAATAKVATDRRTTGQQVEDQAIELKVNAEMRRLFENTGRVHATAYAGRVLLTGDVPTSEARTKAEQAAQGVEKVEEVINEIRIGDITPLSVRTNDTWLTSKVKSALVNTKGVPSRTMTVTTERGVVYLMGKLTADESERATIVASSVNGINRVVKLFEIISPDSIRDEDTPAPATDTKPDSSNDSATDEVQALPVD